MNGDSLLLLQLSIEMNLFRSNTNKIMFQCECIVTPNNGTLKIINCLTFVVHSLKAVDCWSDLALVRVKLCMVIYQRYRRSNTNILPRCSNVSKLKASVMQEYFQRYLSIQDHFFSW